MPVRAPTATLLALASLLVFASAPGVSAAADFVGSESCRVCHQEAFDLWRESAHARAMASLSTDQKKDQRCLQCHARDLALGGDAAVTCESCHGAGEYYNPTYVMRDAELARATGLVVPDQKSCLVCHDASSPSLAPFDALEKMKEIDHWTKNRAARKAKAANDPKAPLESCPRPAAAASRAARPLDSFLARALAPVAKPTPPGKPDAAAPVQVATVAAQAPATPARPPSD